MEEKSGLSSPQSFRDGRRIGVPKVITASADGSGKLFDLESGASLSRVKIDFGTSWDGRNGGNDDSEPSGNNHRYP